jgi:hypothetical protein
VAFPPPPVTFPATRLNACALSDFCFPSGGSLPKGVVRFYPNNPKKFFNLFSSKPFGFDSGRK